MAKVIFNEFLRRRRAQILLTSNDRMIDTVLQGMYATVSPVVRVGFESLQDISETWRREVSIAYSPSDDAICLGSRIRTILEPETLQEPESFLKFQVTPLKEKPVNFLIQSAFREKIRNWTDNYLAEYGSYVMEFFTPIAAVLGYVINQDIARVQSVEVEDWKLYLTTYSTYKDLNVLSKVSIDLNVLIRDIEAMEKHL